MTDYHTLNWVINLRNSAGRFVRWTFEIQQCNFEVEHQKSTKRVELDCLSRAYEGLFTLSLILKTMI